MDIENAHQQANSLNEIVEQGGLASREDYPVEESIRLAADLTEDEVNALTLYHDFRQGRKLGFLEQTGQTTPTEVSDADARSIDDLIEDQFHPLFRQPMTGPEYAEAIEKKSEGQLVEDALVKIFAEANMDFVRAEQASEYLDQGEGKTDLFFFFKKKDKAVRLKVQATGEGNAQRLAAKRAKTPANALLVEMRQIPKNPKGTQFFTNSDVIRLARDGTVADKRSFALKYAAEVNIALMHAPINVYREEKKILGL
ncbi:MAG: hypothetical protein HY975_04235 [Candidatus Kerfeldbacteria bacterium]|nr:hypothetical protein [Candidatus Kerfeldbacteria bacterium]